MFEAWERQGRIKGVKVCKEAPSVHHLLFADDNFIFTRSTIHACIQLKNLLKNYELAFGLAINFHKSCVAFSGNLTEYDGQLLMDCLGMPWVNYHD